MGLELEGEERHFVPFEVSAPHVVYVAVGIFIALFGMFSMLIKERLYLGEAPLAMIFGVIIGPVAAAIFNPAGWGGQIAGTPGDETTNEITLEVTRVCIAVSVFSVGVEVCSLKLIGVTQEICLAPLEIYRDVAWSSDGLELDHLFFAHLGLNTWIGLFEFVRGYISSPRLMVGACLSPTDPILAQAVVGGPWAERHVPAHIRHLLQCESGCNDGAAFPFLFLAYYLTVNRGEVGFPVGKWFYQTWGWEIGLGTLLGAVMGYLARRLIRFSERKKLVDRESFVAQYISLAMASMGANVLLGSDDLLAAFACGSAFAWDGWFQKQTEDSNFGNIVDLLFNIATFVYIGAIMPWHEFVESEIGLSLWRLIVLSILILLCKRIPIVVVLWKFIPDIKTFHEAVFSGYFGPMGVGAIFMSTYGRLLLLQHVEYPPKTTNDYLAYTIQPVVFFLVLASVLVHGFTVPFFAFGRRAHVNLSRTLSIAPSYAFSIDEPGWVSSLRRTMTGAPHPDEEQEVQPEGQTSVVEAMHQGLRRLRDNSSQTDEESRPGTINQSIDARKDQELQDIEDEKAETENQEVAKIGEDEDWGGEDTLEMRKYRQQKAAQRRASSKTRNFADQEKDIADAKMDEDDDEMYPRVNQWLEGHKLVLEYQKSPSSECTTEVIPITEEDTKALRNHEKPFHAWLEKHRERVAQHVEWDKNVPLHESQLSDMFSGGIPRRLSKLMHEMFNGKDSMPIEEAEPSRFGNRQHRAAQSQDQGLDRHLRQDMSSNGQEATTRPSYLQGAMQPTNITRQQSDERPGTIVSVQLPRSTLPKQQTTSSGDTPESSSQEETIDKQTSSISSTFKPDDSDEAVHSNDMSEAQERHVSFAAFRQPPRGSR
ncbi:hypothetical protein MYAM1_001915 [Malassezia yamatoensis]|uniref:Cation/H+ exchanger transmembrane domain-containing protein n=1 Tax=Malassezia yamatoensis TaxID=253288 RepID=A0AAJ5YUX9_9BASI|nr:hypothetical protein MYAM1_001915 [Malassezia yamatoensis]